jgi:DNA-binding NarL/FixJ family response regulator
MNTTTVPLNPEVASIEHRAPAPVGVLLVDETTPLRSRMSRLLEMEPRFRLAGVADSNEQAALMMKRDPVDVAVLVHRPASESPFALCRELKRSVTPPSVVICCADPDDVLAACAMVVEADALVNMYLGDLEWAAVLGRVAHGARLMLPMPSRVTPLLRNCLDPAEHAIFSLLLAGIPAMQIAAALRMSDGELEARRSTLLHKLEPLAPVTGPLH